VITHRIEWADHDGLVMVFGAAHPDLNTYYDAAAKQFIQPKALQLKMGLVSEEEQLDIAMRSYSVGVVLSCEPPMSEDAVYEWFVEHPEEFATLVSYADHRENFTEDVDPNEHGAPGSPTPTG